MFSQALQMSAGQSWSARVLLPHAALTCLRRLYQHSSSTFCVSPTSFTFSRWCIVAPFCHLRIHSSMLPRSPIKQIVCRRDWQFSFKHPPVSLCSHVLSKNLLYPVLNQWLKVCPHTGNSIQLRLCVRIREKHFELVGTEHLNIFRTLGRVTSVSTSVSYGIVEEGERGGTHPQAPVSLYLCINQPCDKASSHTDHWSQVEVGWWSLVVWHEVCR